MRVAVKTKNSAISKTNPCIKWKFLLYLFVGACWAFSFGSQNASCNKLGIFIHGLMMGGSLSIFAIVVLKERVIKTLVYFITTITCVRLYVPIVMAGYKLILWSIYEEHEYHVLMDITLLNVPFLGWLMWNGIYNLLILLPIFIIISVYGAQDRDVSTVNEAKLRLVIKFLIMAHFYIIPDIIETAAFSFFNYSIYVSEKYYMPVVNFFRGIGTVYVLVLMRGGCLLKDSHGPGEVQSLNR
jgi:hypothetical protein